MPTRSKNKGCTSFTDQAGRTSSYAYDLNGNRLTATYPTGVEAKYAYDALNRVSTLEDGSSNSLASFTYDSLNRPTLVTLGNGTTVTPSFDLANRLSSIDNTLAGTTTRNYSYTYDNDSRVGTTTEPRGYVTTSYDYRDELTEVTEPSGSPFADQSFAYDAGFNRSSWVLGSTTTDYTVNNLNQYTAVASATPTWNSDGGLASFAGNTYTYDALLRLTEVDYSAGKTLFSYDPLGRRVKKVDENSGGTVLATYSYHYDGSEVAVEYQPSTTYTYYLGLGIDQVVMRYDGTNKQWYYRDGHGSTSAVADNSGNLLEAYEYTMQGHFHIFNASGTDITSTGTAIGNDILYTGRNYDYETGNYFYRARYYNPTLGRFISRDPLSGAEFKEGTNLYAYCVNNFLNATDPTGMDVYAITNTNAVGGFGHGAMISGNDQSGYTYQSFGSGASSSGTYSGSSASSSGSSNNVTSPPPFSSLDAAMSYAASQNYNAVNEWKTTPEQDKAAQDAMSQAANTDYSLLSHNCQDAVNSALTAAGLTHAATDIPTVAALQNTGNSCKHFGLSK